MDGALPRADTPASETTRILLVDDHPLFVAGVSYILNDLLGQVELLTASTAAEARAITLAHRDLDWLFCDYRLPDADGLALLADFKAAMLAVPVIMVSASEEIALVEQALSLGASGFIPKSADKQVFQQCLSTIERGEIFLPDTLWRQLIHYRSGALGEQQRMASSLSARQREVLQLVASGYSNLEVGKALGISESTVKAHVSALLSLLDADNRAHCVAEARRLKLVV